jgi:hypothetical protein
MLANLPTTTAGFSWLPMSISQYPIVKDLYDRYCKRFSLPPADEPAAQTWLAIVERREDGTNGRIGGIAGVNVDKAKGILEIAHLYVYPTRLGARAFHATIDEAARLYDAGDVKVVCCHVVMQNAKMDRIIAAKFTRRGARPIATLWALGVPL